MYDVLFLRRPRSEVRRTMRAFIPLTVGCLLLSFAAAPAATKDEEMAKYITELSSKDAAKRKSAAEEIGKVGQVKASYAKPALRPLLEVLRDKDVGVRAAAAGALARSTNRKKSCRRSSR